MFFPTDGRATPSNASMKDLLLYVGTSLPALRRLDIGEAALDPPASFEVTRGCHRPVS